MCSWVSTAAVVVHDLLKLFPGVCAADMLCKLVKEAEGFGLVLARDLIGSALGYRAAAAKAWLQRCRPVVADLNNLANDQAALDAGVPVQPVRVRYRAGDGAPATAAAFVGEDTLLASVWRVVSARHLSAEVDVLPAVPPGRHRDRRSLCEAARPGHAGGPPATLGHQKVAKSENICLL